MMNKRKLLRRLVGKEVSVSETKGEFITRGQLRVLPRGGYEVGGMQIPISSMRNVAPWNYGNAKALIFVDPKYGLARRIA